VRTINVWTCVCVRWCTNKKNKNQQIFFHRQCTSCLPSGDFQTRKLEIVTRRVICIHRFNNILYGVRVMATVANSQAHGDLETWRTRDVRAQHIIYYPIWWPATVVGRRQNSVLRARRRHSRIPCSNRSLWFNGIWWMVI